MTVHVLGRVGCTSTDGAFVPLVGHEAMLLSMLTARRGQDVTTETLIDALWDDPPKSARPALQVYVAKLRTKLPPDAVTTVKSSYRLVLDDDDIDVARFERDVRLGVDALDSADLVGAVGRLRAALALWSDPPFGPNADTEPLRTETERLRGIAASAEEALSTAILRSGTDPDVDRLRHLVDQDPYREARWGHLMLGLYRTGRQREALQTYQELRDLLVEEFGIEPMPQLRELNDQILNQDPSLTVTASRRPDNAPSLPAETTPFVGRQAELTRLMELCASHRLVTITGIGGVGKSRLALATARALADAYAGGVALIPLSPLDRGADVDDAVAAALGTGARPGTSAVEMIVRNLADTSTLLLLDNAEQVASSVARLVEELLARCPGVMLLVTSQHQLQVTGEVVWNLGPLDVPDDGAAASDAVELFIDAGRRAAPDSPLDDADRPVIAEICRRLDGLPLALELAASRLASLTPTELLSTLDRPLAALRAGRHATQEHHRTLQALMGWSYDLLDDDERYALQIVSLLPGGCTLDALAAVADLDRVDAADVLDRLVRKSLLAPIQAPSGRRWGMLRTVQEFVEQVELRERDLPDPVAALDRRLRWVTSLARQEGPLVYVDTERALASLESEGVNLRATLRWAIGEGRVTDVLRAGHSLLGFWTFGGHLDDGRETFGAVLDQVGDLPTRERARALHGSGVIAAFDTDYDRAYSALGEAAGLFAAQHDRSSLGWTRFWTGRTISAQVFAGQAGVDRLLDADAAYHEADVIFTEVEDPLGLTFTRMFTGWNAMMLGEPDRAHEVLSGILVVAEAIDATQPIGMLNGMLAAVLAHQGDLATADVRAQRSVELLRQVGDKMNSQICEAVAAMVACADHRLDDARGRLLRALELQERHGSREWDGFTLYVTMAVLGELGDAATPALIAASLDRYRPSWRDVQANLGLPALRSITEIPAAPYALPIVDLLRRCVRAVEAFD